MKDLIEALTIFMKYDSGRCIYCSYENLAVCVEPRDVTIKDVNRLSELSFDPDDDGQSFSSYKYGSC